MNELTDLYQQLILDHNQNPCNFGELATATHRAEGHNPLCGDTCVVQLALAGDRVVDVRFSGAGCAISKASASLMTGHILGKSLPDIEASFASFHALVTGQGDPSDNDRLGKLRAFAGVRVFPMRVKCATLAWHTLRAALHSDTRAEPATVSTE